MLLFENSHFKNGVFYVMKQLSQAKVIFVVGNNVPDLGIGNIVPKAPKLRMVGEDETPELLPKEIHCCIAATD